MNKSYFQLLYGTNERFELERERESFEQRERKKYEEE